MVLIHCYKAKAFKQGNSRCTHKVAHDLNSLKPCWQHDEDEFKIGCYGVNLREMRDMIVSRLIS